MSFHTILRAVRSHPWLTASIPVIAIVVALAISLMLPNRYTAVASVLLDLKTTDPLSGGYAGMIPPGYMATQVDIVRSERVAKSVIKRLKLDQQAQLLENWRDAGESAGEFQNWLVALLQKDLFVKPSRESNIIELSYSAANPDFAAVMTNAFMQAYIDTSIELKVEPAKQYNARFEEQAKKMRERLEEAQRKLSAYQRDKGIIATDERLDVENARLQELSSQLVTIQALSEQSSSRNQQVEKNANSLDEVLANPVISGLKADLSRQEARLQELSTRYGTAHPTVAETKANIDELRARLASETRVVTGSVNLNSNVNKNRESQVRVALEQQRAKVLQIKAQRDQVNAMEADMVNAQRGYEAVMARFNQTELESRSNQTNVTPLQVASKPLRPSSPRTLLNILSAGVIGLVLGVLAALLSERIDHRLRDKTDLSSDISALFVGAVHEINLAKEGAAQPMAISTSKRHPLALTIS
jgi:succinoglycan biosynthesis transport protein ExoP